MIVKTEFERALEAILARVFFSEKQPRAMAVAYSGGLDSTVLLHLAKAYAAEHTIPLYAFHIHHGLQKDADNWLLHCKKECERLGVLFDTRQVVVDTQSREGIEAAARRSRYAALGELCRLHKVPLILTAHHQDDQVETVLLQLMRGSGVAGLSGMDSMSKATALLGTDALLLGRPLLFVSRHKLENWLENWLGSCLDKRHVAYVEDLSNKDVRFARNAVRHAIIPVLTQFFPSAQKNIARTAQHAQFAQRILNEVAEQDWAVHRRGEALNVSCFTALSLDRIDNLLRYWLGLVDARMPSTAWLEQARTQLMMAKPDAQINITLGDFHIRRYRDLISIQIKRSENLPPEERAILSFIWDGEKEKRVDSWGGVFVFQEADEGIDADWLRQQTLQVRSYSGAEKLKLGANRHGRHLKAHYQALGIPAWERQYLPLLYVDNTLMWAAGIGLACRYKQYQAGKCIRLEWLPDGGKQVKCPK